MLARARGADRLVRADILDLPFAAASVDGVTSGFALRNVVDIARSIGEMARVVRPGGRVAVVDLAEPRAATRWIHATWVDAGRAPPGRPPLGRRGVPLPPRLHRLPPRGVHAGGDLP